LKDYAHRHIWQRLPRGWRREALFNSAALLAPQADLTAVPAEPIIVAGVLSTASGLGESARLCHDALKAAGHSVYGVDLSASLMQDSDVADFKFQDGRALTGAGTLILHVNSPLVPLAMWRLGRLFVRQKYIVGYWAWELARVPTDWRHGVRFVREIWVPSQFAAESVRPIAGERTVRVIPHPVVVLGAPKSQRQPSVNRPFTVLTMFNMASGFTRKNPLAAIEAFRLAFGNDPATRLVIKVSNMTSFQPGAIQLSQAVRRNTNIVILDATIGRAELDRLYADADIVISLHRSEGFGLSIAEAMKHGIATVATDWSGNRDFLNHKTGIPIPYKMIPAEDPQGTYQQRAMDWADADVNAAAKALRGLRDDPQLRVRLGQSAAIWAERAWSSEMYSLSVREALAL